MEISGQLYAPADLPTVKGQTTGLGTVCPNAADGVEYLLQNHIQSAHLPGLLATLSHHYDNNMLNSMYIGVSGSFVYRKKFDLIRIT